MNKQKKDEMNYAKLRKGVESVVLQASAFWEKGDLAWIEPELLRLLKETK